MPDTVLTLAVLSSGAIAFVLGWLLAKAYFRIAQARAEEQFKREMQDIGSDDPIELKHQILNLQQDTLQQRELLMNKIDKLQELLESREQELANMQLALAENNAGLLQKQRRSKKLEKKVLHQNQTLKNLRAARNTLQTQLRQPTAAAAKVLSPESSTPLAASGPAETAAEITKRKVQQSPVDGVAIRTDKPLSGNGASPVADDEPVDPLAETGSFETPAAARSKLNGAAPADNLEALFGVGPALHQKLNAKGIYRFEQLAVLSPKDISKLGKQLSINPARIKKYDWRGQAQKLQQEVGTS
ncbi:MAG: hypothetical protein ACR2P6_05285 [Gammaproteobacteria bacterium]